MQNLFTTDYTTEDTIREISIRNNEPNWLIERRLNAFNNYQNLPFDKDTLFYKYTNFKNLNPRELAINMVIQRHVDLKNVNIFETDNEVIFSLTDEMKNKGVILTTLTDLSNNNEELAHTIVEKVGFSNNFDKLGCLSRAFAPNQIVLYVPRNVVIEKPIFKKTTIKNDKISMYSEFICVFGENSQATIVETFSSSDNKTMKMYMGMHSIYLGENSNINYYQIQAWDQKTTHIDAKIANISRNATLHEFTHTQGSDMSRINSYIMLEGEGSEGYDLFTNFGNNRQRFDIKAEIRHIGTDTIGQVHSRTVMMNRSESILRGLMDIPETAINANSNLTSKGLSIGRGKITAIPALKIDQNEIVAGHSASVEPINPEYIFYLSTRGIPETLAREMMVKGYFEDVINYIQNNEIKDMIHEFLDTKWNSI